MTDEAWTDKEAQTYWEISDLYYDMLTHGEAADFFAELNEDGKAILDKAERIGVPVDYEHAPVNDDGSSPLW